MSNEEIIRTEIRGLREWLAERFDRLDERDDERAADIERNRICIEDHEQRIIKLERYPWLIAGLAAVTTPIVVWGLIEAVKALVGLLG
jgi:hypothetical protein